MANNIFNNFNIGYNSIADQKLTASNTLTVKSWNDIITILKTQANINATYLSSLNKWLIGNDPVSIPSGDSFVDYINTYIGEMPNTVMDIINKNSLGFTTIDIGYSTNYNITSDKELPTTKAVNKMLDGPRKDIVDIEEALEYKADLVDGKVPLEQLDTKETGELLVGTSTNYDTSRDDQIPTTKAVNKMLDGPRKDIADINGKLESKADLKDGKIPASQLPSYVDDVIEGYYEEEGDKFYTDSTKETEIVAETGKVYVDVNTNTTYRWSGSQYTVIGKDLALGYTSSTAYPGNEGKANAEAIKKLNEIVPDLLPVEITYEELKALKDNNELIVGQKYRIIDYETTTIQHETQSAGHPFDIIVTATSENTFDENASACARKGDNYFGTWYEKIESATGEFLDNVTPESIEVAYTILVDEFGEASSDKYVGGLKNGSDQIVEIGYAENNGGIEVPIFYKNDIGYIESGEEGTDYQDTFFYVGTEEFDGVVYDKWRKIESGGTYVWDNNTKIFVLTNQVVRKLQSQVSTITHKGKPLESWKIKYCFDNDNERYGWVPNEFMIYTDDSCWFNRDGEFEYNGTKYYKWVSPQMGDNEFLLSQTLELNVGDMLDHYFIEEDAFETEYSTIEKTTNAGKGVIYYMKDEWNNECPYDFKNIMFNGFFTFTFQDGNDNLDGTMQTFKNDEGLETHFIDNSIDTFQESVYEDGTIRYIIPYGNVFSVYLESANDFCVRNNKIGKNCSYNTFGNYCLDNILNDNCSGNSFGEDTNNIKLCNECGDNKFSGECYYITLGANSSGNIIESSGYLSTGTEFYGNTIYSSVKYTTFGNGCHDNEIYSVSNSTFGNNCSNNTFENTVDSCSFGNNVTDNKFWGDVENSTFGNSVVENDFLDDIINSSFGNYVNNNFIRDIDHSIFGNDIVNSNLTAIKSSTFGSDLLAVDLGSMSYCSIGNHIHRVHGDYIFATTIENYCEDIKIGGDDSRAIYISNSHIGNNVKNINIISNDRSISLRNFKINSNIYGGLSPHRLIIDFDKIGSNIYFDGIETQITLDKDKKGQILMYWNDDKLKKVGYYLESNSSTEWLPIPEENAGGGMSADTYKQKYQEILWLGSDEIPLLPTDLTSLPASSVSSLLTNMKAIWSDIHVDIVELYGYDRVVFLAYVDSIKKIVKCTIRYQESNSTYVLNVHSSIYKENVKECISIATYKRYQLFRDNSSSYVNSLTYYLTEISGYSNSEIDNKLYGVLRYHSKTVNIKNKNDDNTIYFDDVINTYLPIRIEINGFYYFLIKNHENMFEVYDEENDEQISFSSFFDGIVLGGYTTDNEMCINPNYLSDNCVVDVVYYVGACSTRYEI